MFDFREVILEEEKQLVINFLSEGGLDYEYDIDYSILVYNNEEIIATASLSNNIMKCFLIKKNIKDKI